MLSLWYIHTFKLKFYAKKINTLQDRTSRYKAVHSILCGSGSVEAVRALFVFVVVGGRPLRVAVGNATRFVRSVLSNR